MIWNSLTLMTIIDVMIFMISVISLWSLYKHRLLLRESNLVKESSIIVFGIMIIGIFYLLDLYSMWIMPLFTSAQAAEAFMEDLHLNYSWGVILMSVLLIVGGFTFMLRNLIFHNRELLEGKNEIAKLNSELKESNTLYLQQLENRKHAEKSLRESEEKYRNLVEDQTEFIVRWNPDGTRTFVNNSYCKYFGKSRDQLIGSTFFPLISKSDLEKVKNRLAALSPDRPVSGDEHRVIREDGSIGWNHWVDRGIFDENGKLISVHSVGRDITDRKNAEAENKRLEEKLFQAKKMESIGRLAGGIAHDFNNILTSIMGYAEILSGKFKADEISKEMAAKTIIRNAKMGSDLTTQLLEFARESRVDTEPINLNAVIHNSLKIVDKAFEHNVKIVLDLFEPLQAVEADATQIERVLMNLLTNARDAMTPGGKITISSANVYADSDNENSTAKSVRISVEDSGMGMPKEVQSKIFEPFFTTKTLGKGTGLGLANVYGIVRSHNGRIEVSSEEGKGTTFDIYFPASDKKIKTTTKDEVIYKGSETMLVVDEEEIIRILEKELLEGIGYQVMLANNGKEAVTLYSQKKNEIDLIIIDMTMSLMNGKDTFLELKKIDPEIKAIVVSGFSEGKQVKELIDHGVKDIIQKPFDLHKISKIIRNVLDNGL